MSIGKNQITASSLLRILFHFKTHFQLKCCLLPFSICLLMSDSAEAIFFNNTAEPSLQKLNKNGIRTLFKANCYICLALSL